MAKECLQVEECMPQKLMPGGRQLCCPLQQIAELPLRKHVQRLSCGCTVDSWHSTWIPFTGYNTPVNSVYASQLPTLSLHLSVEAGHAFGYSHLQRVASLPAKIT